MGTGADVVILLPSLSSTFLISFEKEGLGKVKSTYGLVLSLRSTRNFCRLPG